VSGAADRPLTVFLIAGEESGDALGANLMESIVRSVSGEVRFLGVGGARMERLGLVSMFRCATSTTSGRRRSSPTCRAS